VQLFDWTYERRQERELIALLSRSESGDETVGIAGWSWDVRSATLQCSRDYVRIYGLDPRTVRLDHKAWLNMMHPEDRPRVQKALATALSGTGKLHIEFRALRPDGSVASMAACGHVIFDRNGMPVNVVGRTLNKTGFKPAESMTHCALPQEEVCAGAAGKLVRPGERAAATAGDVEECAA
jgi:PAS domain S-box-containing protein